MGTDTGSNLLEPATPGREPALLFFCTAVIQAVNKHQGCCAPRSRPGQDHRLAPTRPPPGDHLDLPGLRAREGLRHDRGRQGRQEQAGLVPSASARRCCRRCRCTAATATPHQPVRVHRQQVRVPGPCSSASLSMPNTVLNTIVAEAIDDLATKLATALKKRGATLEDAAALGHQGQLDRQQAGHLGGDNYAEEVAQGGREARPAEPAQHRGRAAAAGQAARRSACSASTTCSPSARSSRATRSSSSSTSSSSTSRRRPRRRSRGRCCCPRRCAPQHAHRVGRGADNANEGWHT